VRVAAIVGPTAAGKTGVALESAAAAGAEIIGADSVQVYKHFDIGSAKPTPAERARVPHHLVDVVEPDQEFSAADYARLAHKAAHALAETGRRAIFAGGTGLYLRAAFEGLMPAPGKDDAVRARLNEETVADLRRRLSGVDPAWAARIQGDDRYRLVRALEIYEATGLAPSAWAERQKRESAYEVLWIGLTPERPVLYERIDARVEAMWAAGLPDEVRALAARGWRDTRPMRSVGYAEALAHVEGRAGRDEALAAAKQRTRRYAKRQLTWFRANAQIHWFDASQTGTVDRIKALMHQWFT
jgi:tRNA dimethylallyltransferase